MGRKTKQDLEGFLERSAAITSPAIRASICHPRFEKSWEARKQEILCEHGDFVLFTSRFGSANHFRRTLDETVDRRMELYTGDASETAPERFATCGGCSRTIWTSSARWRPASPSRTLSSAPIRSRIPTRGGLASRTWRMCRCVMAAPAIPWLSAARCVVHSACTTRIEAYILGRPVTEYYPAAIPRGELDPLLPRQDHRRLQ